MRNPEEPGAPRWVKVSAIVAGVVAVLVVAALLTGGEHGPGRHTGGADAPPPAHTPPPGAHP